MHLSRCLAATGKPDGERYPVSVSDCSKELILMNLFDLSPVVLSLGFAVLIVSIAVSAGRQRQGYPPAGRLNAVMMFTACMLIGIGLVGIAPILLAQLGGAITVEGQSSAAVNVQQLSAQAEVDTSTPSHTLSPTITPTGLPTLTPAPTETDIVLVTPLTYPYADVSSTVDCSVIANTTLNLRPEPSLTQRAIGRVLAGSVLPVTGRSADKRWWRVINNHANASVEGWVSAQYVTADKACDNSEAPVIVPTAPPSRTPLPSRTPCPTPTPKPSATTTSAVSAIATRSGR